MKNTILAIVIAAGLTSFEGSANAQTSPLTWNWNLTDATTQESLGSGQFVTDGTLLNGDVWLNGWQNVDYYQINSISGNYLGVTITGLIGAPYDNKYIVFQNSNVDYQGIGFTTAAPFPNSRGDWGNFTYENISTKNINPGNNLVTLYNNYIDGWAPNDSDNTLFNDGVTFTVTAPTPEPSTYALFGLGALALVVAFRRRNGCVATAGPAKVA
jgi:hypothetical protein